jgi:hypothetical protein
MQNEGLLNSQGIYNPDDFEKMKEALPVNLVEKATPLFKACGDASSKSKIHF